METKVKVKNTGGTMGMRGCGRTLLPMRIRGSAPGINCGKCQVASTKSTAAAATPGSKKRCALRRPWNRAKATKIASVESDQAP